MNYDRPELLDRLAADYAVGVMRGGARTRFEKLCARLPAAQKARRLWEDTLMPLASQLAPVTPSAGVWPRILRSIEAAEGAIPVDPAPSRRSFRPWGLAAAATLAAIAVLVGRTLLWNTPAWQTVAMLAPADAAPLWKLERDASASYLHIETVGSVAVAPSKSYELWVLPKGSGNPVSLGLLPQSGVVKRSLTAAQRDFLLAGAKVAVSLEPAGGSVTGAPTGPIVIVVPIVTGA